jgi:hypothetical protein
MAVISLKTAKKLKLAGLPWEPKIGDWYFTYHDAMGCLTQGDYLSGVAWEKVREEVMTFCPRLDQLLAEIIKQSWLYDLRGHYGGGGEIDIWLYDYEKAVNYCADTPEEASAQALLWIIGQEGQA